MDSFEWNKIFMGLGFSALAVLGINELTGAVYHVEKPETAGYVVEGVEVASAGEAEAAGPVVLPDFGTLLASADVAAGQAVAGKCAQCHSWDKGGANKIGPNLYGIVGANHAHLGDAYAYSAALKAKSGEPWDYAALYQFFEAPARAIRGTKMAFAGLKRQDERINLIAFLRTQADSPYPLPAPTPAAAEPVAEPAETPPADAAPAESPAADTTPAETAPPAEEPAAAPPPASPAPSSEPDRIDAPRPPNEQPAAPSGPQPDSPPSTPSGN